MYILHDPYEHEVGLYMLSWIPQDSQAVLLHGVKFPSFLAQEI